MKALKNSVHFLKTNRVVRLMCVTLWLPLFWVVLVCVDVLWLGTGAPKAGFAKAFESLVFFSSFLFYRSDWVTDPQARTIGALVLRFSLQFFFWWAFSLTFAFAYQLKDKYRR